MIYIIDPPFVEGNNLSYLSQQLQSFLLSQGLEFSTVPQKMKARSGTGFYNDYSWMSHNRGAVQNAMDNMDNGDVFIFVDFWNPAIQFVWLQAKLRRMNIRIIGWFHGSTFLEHDYLIKSGIFKTKENLDAIRYAEYSWFSMCDQIWSTSEYFDQGIPQQFRKKILRVYEPFDSREYAKYRSDDKQFDIVYPFRLDKDKVDMTVLFYVINNMPNRSFLITTPSEMPLEMKTILKPIKNVTVVEHCVGDAHLLSMARSKVIFSTAFQEGWGYSVLKGVSVGCIPILPDRAVYRELYHGRFLYDGSDKDALYKLRHVFYTYNTFDLPQMPIIFGFHGMEFNGGILQYRSKENEGSNTRRIV